MLRIRDEQSDELDDHQARDFCDTLVGLLQEQFDDARLENELRLREGIMRQVGRARGYGLTTEHQIASFVMTAWMLGDEFEIRFPACGSILSRPGLSPDERVASIEAWTVNLFEILER